MVIDFDEEAVFTQSIDIADTGNFCIRCKNDSGTLFYVLVKTSLGKTSILKTGPIIPDLPILVDSFSVTFRKIDYNEGKISKDVSMFVNDSKKKITSVEEVTQDDFNFDFPNILEAFNND